MTFYEKLSALCLERGIDVSNLGQYVSVENKPLSSSTIGNWRSGSKPRSKAVKAIADYFMVPVSYLRGDEQEVVKPTPVNNCESCPCREKCTCDLSDQEHEIIKMFRDVTQIGKMRMIKEILAVWENDQ